MFKTLGEDIQMVSAKDQQQLDKVYVPIGLEIGTETPEELAISILAEVIKVRRTKGGRR